MSWLCLFLKCKLARLLLVVIPYAKPWKLDPLGQRQGEVWLMQCSRCKRLEVDVERPPGNWRQP